MTDRSQSLSPLEVMKQDVHYRTLAEAIPQIVWTANPDGWLDFYNQHWFDYTGLTLNRPGFIGEGRVRRYV